MNKFTTPLFRVSLLVLTMAIASGCGTMKLPPYQAKPVDSYPNQKAQKGLSMAIHPVVDREESKTYFGTDLFGNKVLAVLVVAENQTDSTSFLISKEGCSLSAGKFESQGGRQEGPATGAGAEAAAWTAVALAPVSIAAVVIALPIALKLASDATVINQNFLSKALQANTISPGRSVNGFVYFKLPDKTPVPPQLSLRVEAQQLPSKVTNTFHFVFDTKLPAPTP